MGMYYYLPDFFLEESVDSSDCLTNSFETFLTAFFCSSVSSSPSTTFNIFPSPCLININSPNGRQHSYNVILLQISGCNQKFIYYMTILPSNSISKCGPLLNSII